MRGGASSLLHGLPGRVCSPVVGVEATRVRMDQASLPLSVCPAPNEVSGEASERHVFTQVIHQQLHSGSGQGYVPIVCLRSSIRLWCGVGWGWRLGVGGAGCGCKG